MIPLNSTLVYQNNSMSRMWTRPAINHHKLIHTFICSKTDPQKTFSPRRVRISQKEDRWVVKPSNHIKLNAKQRQWPPMFLCSLSKTNTVLWKCFIVIFQSQKTKTSKQKPLVKHHNFWSLWANKGIKSFPLVQKRLTLFIVLYNEFLSFLDKS